MGGTFDSPASGGGASSSSSSSSSWGSGATRSGRFGDGLRGGRTPSPSSPPSSPAPSSGAGATRPGRWGDGLRGGWGGGRGGGSSPSGAAGSSSAASGRSARPWTGGPPDFGVGAGGLAPGSGAAGGRRAGALSPSAGPSAGRARVTGPGSGAGRPASGPDRRPASGQTASGQTASGQSASRAPADPQAETDRQIAAIRERQAAQEKADRQARAARDAAREAAREAERAAAREAWPGGLAAGKAAPPKRQTPRPAGPRPGDAAPLSLSESAAKAPSRSAQYVTQMPPQRSAPLSDEAEGDIARLAAAVNRTKDLSGLEPIVKGALEAEPWRALPEMSRLREQVRDADNLAWIDRMIDRYGPRATGPEPPATPLLLGREDDPTGDLIAGPDEPDTLTGGGGRDALGDWSDPTAWAFEEAGRQIWGAITQPIAQLQGRDAPPPADGPAQSGDEAALWRDASAASFQGKEGDGRVTDPVALSDAQANDAKREQARQALRDGSFKPEIADLDGRAGEPLASREKRLSGYLRNENLSDAEREAVRNAYFDTFARDPETSPFAPKDGEDTARWLERVTKRFDDPDATMEERLAIAAAVVSRYDPSFNRPPADAGDGSTLADTPAADAPQTGTSQTDAPQAGTPLPPGLKKLLPDTTDPVAVARFLRAQNVSPDQSFGDLVEVENPGPILKALAAAGTLDVALAQGLLLTPDGKLYRKGTVWRSDVKPDATRSVGERMQATLGTLYGVMVGGGHDGSWAPGGRPFVDPPKPK